MKRSQYEPLPDPPLVVPGPCGKLVTRHWACHAQRPVEAELDAEAHRAGNQRSAGKIYEPRACGTTLLLL